MSAARMHEIWGEPAVPTDEALYEKAKQSVPWQGSVTLRAALANKAYRALGGRFAFPSRVDSFIEGLHRRTQDLHKAWVGGQARDDRNTSASLRRKAVAEMLLRLRWDDSDDGARARLIRILEQIWDRLEGREAAPAALASAIWVGPDEAAASGERDDGWEVLGDMP